MSHILAKKIDQTAEEISVKKPHLVTSREPLLFFFIMADINHYRFWVFILSSFGRGKKYKAFLQGRQGRQGYQKKMFLL
jgi:hypothetical protein